MVELIIWQLHFASREGPPRVHREEVSNHQPKAVGSNQAHLQPQPLQLQVGKNHFLLLLMTGLRLKQN